MSAPETKVAGILIGLSDMEDEVRRVEQWAEVLCAPGAGGNDLSVDAVYPIGEALERVGAALREHFRAMHALASGSGGAAPCA